MVAGVNWGGFEVARPGGFRATGDKWQICWVRGGEKLNTETRRSGRVDGCLLHVEVWIIDRGFYFVGFLLLIGGDGSILYGEGGAGWFPVVCRLVWKFVGGIP